MYQCEYNGSEYPECDLEELELLEKVDLVCKEEGLRWRYFPGSGLLFAYSNLSVWKFKLRGPKYALYHQNTYRNTTRSYLGCFHRQQYQFDDLESVLGYIAKHDTRKYEKEAHRIRDSSMERAYRKIRKQKAMHE